MDYKIRLLELRSDLNLTQDDIAKVLKISRSTYKDYELQTSIIPIKHLVTLSGFYHVSVDYILGLTSTRQYKQTYEVDKIKAGQRLKEFRLEYNLHRLS